MLPLILIAPDKKAVNKYIKALALKNDIKPYYIYRIEPEKNVLGIEDIKKVILESAISVRDKRLFMISDINLATAEAQNAFLKTLEENNSNKIYLLSATTTAGILPTILSRSQLIKLEKKDNPEFNFDDIIGKELSVAMGDERFSCPNKETAIKAIDSLIAYFHGKIGLTSGKNIQILEYALDLRQKITTINLIPQLAVDMLLIFISKNYTMD